MSGYVDCHSHGLPGFDYGPGDLDAALAMLKAAARLQVSDEGLRLATKTP